MSGIAGGTGRVAGVDEVGRGPLAGPVVAAAVILPEGFYAPGLTDSKKLTARRREALDEQIRDGALAWALGRAEAGEIDRLNIHRATLLAMQRAVQALDPAPAHLLVDGRFTPEGPWTAEARVGGDGSVAAISAASVIAKVARDGELRALHEQWPEYGFDRHAGYPTAAHRAALEQHGPCPEHRRSYGPVARALAAASEA
ncbi:MULTISPECIES: ribonuclease HII [unclassified Thioalkalivibrio]|uniref:ribonuclease HII n=1 Tax=unclassified Thioalkalivibrio TaxID=2621013 RepID=UPI000417C4EB|nr:MULTISPECIES: ribonuclease HII [unclassified Thioalkalivibrio]PYG03820.1 RNase HII [Thioalkalivibrio sp. ALE21]